jgi:hypothetical protein
MLPKFIPDLLLKIYTFKHESWTFMRFWRKTIQSQGKHVVDDELLNFSLIFPPRSPPPSMLLLIRIAIFIMLMKAGSIKLFVTLHMILCDGCRIVKTAAKC